jgi:hypothetical protein
MHTHLCARVGDKRQSCLFVRALSVVALLFCCSCDSVGESPFITDETPEPAHQVSNSLDRLTGEETAAESKSPVRDISGTWNLTITVDKTDCGESIETEEHVADVSQTGNRVAFSISGIVLKGTISGATVSISGKYNELGEITKALVLTVSGDRLKGTGKWTYDAFGVYSCKGTEKVSGVKEK